MIKIPSTEQIRELDRLTMADNGIVSLELTERAAQTVATALMKRWPAEGRDVVIFAGPGNNGADALVVARLLSVRGYAVKAFLFNTSGKLSADCRACANRLRESGMADFTEVTAQFEPPQLTAQTLVVDGLFGTGLSRPLSGGFASLVRLINSSQAEVLSIDVPSGVLCDTAVVSGGPVVEADVTFTFQLPKLQMLLPDTGSLFGEVNILNIGLSAERIAAMDCACLLLEEEDARAMLVPRAAFGHKGTFGHALLIAGRYGMAGAAVLTTKACLRSGVGKVTLRTAQMVTSIVQIAVPEAVVSPDRSDEVFSKAVAAEGFDAVAIGPGIGTDKATAQALIEQITHTDKPLVLDADALNILANHQGWLNQLPAGTVLTPHPAELRRLCRLHEGDDRDTFDAAKELAQQRQVYVVLKGHRTAVITPHGRVFFNSTGNSGMATAGSGDVLTGIIGSLLAQGHSALTACSLGVYLHGLAGDIAAEKLTEYCLTASDIIDHLPAAFKQLEGRGCGSCIEK